MAKHFASCFILLGWFLTVHCQPEIRPLRYKDFVFQNIIVQKNIDYHSEPNTDTKEKYYLFDFYEPKNDSVSTRPLIIWMHGGGFKFGTKTSRGTPIWSKTFAQRGYVCAAINYRLSKKRPLARFPDLVEGCYDAIEDLKTALLFFKRNQRLYRIDTNCIILAGNSAGGMIALQAVYSDSAELLKLIHPSNPVVPHSSQNNLNIAAIINFWGALFDINSLVHARVPIVSAHGSRDRVVPFEGKGPLYGSATIHSRSDSLNIHNDLKIFTGYGHELQKHFIPIFAGGKVKQRWLQAGQFAADFLYIQLFENSKQNQ